MEMKMKFEAKSARVKGIAFHPSKPWIITSLHNSFIEIWDYNMKICITKFEGHEGPVRGVDFHPQLPLFVSGGDDGFVKLWDYKQKRCLFTLKGHIDYIRSTYFHHELPWILSTCDDQTMRIWNYQSRACVNIITGHSHYVMCAQFHHEKNFIVSGSLDSTVRIWDFTVLKKKLTESKNLSSFIGIEIQCIKILDGHDRGVNWVCFHPTQNLIASCSDDKKIKLWKYTNEVAWEHSTITGHKNNVSCVIFDQKSNNLISNSQDKNIKVWNYQTKNQLQSYKRNADRYWIMKISKNGNLLSAGHDGGFQIFEINKEIVPHGMIQKNLLIFAQGMKSFLYDIEKKVQKEELYQYNPKDKNSLVFVNKIIVNPFDSTSFAVQLDEAGQKVFMVKKKESYLNFPSLVRTIEALDACFISSEQFAVLHSNIEIHLYRVTSKDQKRTVLKLNDKLTIQRIFSSKKEGVIIFTTPDCIAEFDLKQSKIIGQQTLEPDSNIHNITFAKNQSAICGKNIILLVNNDFQTITTIKQKFSIKSAFWERQNLLFYTTKNHWKYALTNGETGVLKTLEEPFHLVRKLKDKTFLAFNENKKVFEIECPQYAEIEFKLAVQEKNWSLVNEIMSKVGKEKKNLVAYLVEKGHASVAIEMTGTCEQKFALAIQATNFQLAFEMCNQINTIEYWKILGQEALRQGIYEAYELSNQKQKQYDRLNFLYSLQSNTPKLEKMLKLSSKMNNSILAFNSALFLGNIQEQEQILRSCGLDNLAELASQANNSLQVSDRLKKLGCQKLNIIKPEGETDFSNWPHNMIEEDEN